MLIRPILLIFFMTSFIVGCVSSSKHDELLAKHKEMGEKNRELQIYVAELEQRLGKASTDKSSLQSDLSAMKSALREAAERKKESDRRMAEYRQLIQRFKSLTDAGQLSIKIVDGRMVVALPSDILFASGSSRLSGKGNETIGKVTEILVGVSDKKFQVEGHTDNVPIRTKSYPSNWELASARAINVLKTMVSSGMPEHRISAASFGETRPFQSNDSKEGKQANRRIEVVVVPDLSSLPGYDELRKLSRGN